MGVLWHQSGINRKNEPFVQLLLDDKVICQLTPEEARSHAQQILEATEAAEQDAFIFSFFTENLGGTPEQASGVIVDFRRWREARGKKGPPSDRSEFVVTDQHQKNTSQPEKFSTENPKEEKPNG